MYCSGMRLVPQLKQLVHKIRPRYFATASQDNVQQANTLLQLANKAISSNDPKLALTQYLQSIELHPSAEAMFNAGNTYLQLENPKQALDMYEKSLKLNQHPDTLVNMANITFLIEKKTKLAIELYLQAIRLHESQCVHPMSPKEQLAHGEIWFNLGCVYDAGATEVPLPEEIGKAIELWDQASMAFRKAHTLGLERADLLARNVVAKRNARFLEHGQSSSS